MKANERPERLGAEALATDVHPRMLELVNQVAAFHGTSATTFLCKLALR